MGPKDDPKVGLPGAAALAGFGAAGGGGPKTGQAGGPRRPLQAFAGQGQAPRPRYVAPSPRPKDADEGLKPGASGAPERAHSPGKRARGHVWAPPCPA